MVTANEAQKIVTTCPDCGQRLGFRGRAELGRRIVCVHCGVELKIVKMEPVTLGKAFKE